MSRYSADDDYCYPGTSVLRNKLNYQDQESLDLFEAEITTLRMIELQESPIVGNFDLAHLQKIHFHIFQDVYDWAGEIRYVDISRGDSRFANQNYIE
jgi:cell filamentation protein